ncbi:MULTISPECIES: membrane protein insertase YidC [unclassified Paludibacterium]|uniref:membrane protein insertase YidC n=1 Tax=unclassified Paludibacterium TaxID=2618429 RepID=UPI001C0437DD|nr:membrane protein insertase YidC [Paludibacterium sp. B53371]BEV72636.1 membrane protein insertase YidC [Paludibacterium sp. THUN1379]
MDSKRLILFIVLSLGILLIWQEKFAPKPQPAAVVQSQTASASAAAQPAGNTSAAEVDKLARGQRITVNTDLIHAEIDTTGGDLRSLQLLKHDSTTDAKKPFDLLTDTNGRVYVAQTGLLADSNPALPTHKTVFTSAQQSYQLTGDSLEVKLTAPDANGVKVSKIYIFKRGSYDIGVRYEITNGGSTPIAPTAYYRLMRDGKAPEGASSFAQTFTGPAVYTEANKFQKVKFDDLVKGKGDYTKDGHGGWIGMLQHYFMTAWLMKPTGGQDVCLAVKSCRFDMGARDGLYSADALLDLKPIAPGKTFDLTVPLYAGPEEYSTITKVADGLEYSKDYGIFYIFASPLFWLLTKLHGLVSNWGWAIILLTLIVKAVFYPLTAASYRSMGKMKALSPRLERLKEQFGDDRVKFQQAVMEMYKSEKVNPLGGCLPMLIQIPVFIGLYWALLSSVELRQAPWILWYTDLARPEALFTIPVIHMPVGLLPIIMMATMFLQTFLNPPPTDPVQAKMMKIMPLAFSIMFFFFPAGLVLYYTVNSILSIAQQWYINRSIEQAKKVAQQS